MSNQVINYKHLVVDKTSITRPEKSKGRYFSYISNSQNPMWVQTPSLTVVKITPTEIHFSLKKTSVFANTINTFDDFCVDYIASRTTEFFNGKRFSREKISSSYERTLVGNEEDDYHVLIARVVDKDNLFIRDQRNIHRIYEDIKPGYETICILDWEGIAFNKSSMKVVCTVQQMKIYVNESLTNWSIEQDTDDEQEDDSTLVDPEDIEAQVRSLEESSEEPVVTVSKDMKDTKDIKDIKDIPLDNLEEVKKNSSKKVIEPSFLLNDDDQDLF